LKDLKSLGLELVQNPSMLASLKDKLVQKSKSFSAVQYRVLHPIIRSSTTIVETRGRSETPTSFAVKRYDTLPRSVQNAN
jgi:DNA-directed RNA polymerase subunit L